MLKAHLKTLKPYGGATLKQLWGTLRRGYVTSLNKQSRHGRESASKQCQYRKAISPRKCFNTALWYQSDHFYAYILLM